MGWERGWGGPTTLLGHANLMVTSACSPYSFCSSAFRKDISVCSGASWRGRIGEGRARVQLMDPSPASGREVPSAGWSASHSGSFVELLWEPGHPHSCFKVPLFSFVMVCISHGGLVGGGTGSVLSMHLYECLTQRHSEDLANNNSDHIVLAVL